MTPFGAEPSIPPMKHPTYAWTVIERKPGTMTFTVIKEVAVSSATEAIEGCQSAILMPNQTASALVRHHPILTRKFEFDYEAALVSRGGHEDIGARIRAEPFPPSERSKVGR